jgi:hypothetical protein
LGDFRAHADIVVDLTLSRSNLAKGPFWTGFRIILVTFPRITKAVKAHAVLAADASVIAIAFHRNRNR